MGTPAVGWERETPIPDLAFNDYLSARAGHLYFGDLDLAQLFLGGNQQANPGKLFNSPLEIVYRPKIRQQIANLRQTFATAIDQIQYQGKFLYAYASKANAAEEVVRTALSTEAHYEISSSMDVEIALLMKEEGLLTPEKMIICNGFKGEGTQYAESILRLKRQHDNVIPVVEDLSELSPLTDSGLNFEVGLRQKSYGDHRERSQMEAADSRFGMKLDDLKQAAEIVKQAPNLKFVLYHAMVGGQITQLDDFLGRLEPPIEIYTELRRSHPHLSIFNFGGGLPVAMTLDFSFDYADFAQRLLSLLQEVCEGAKVQVPDVMGEMGRYTVAEHGAHLFKVLTVKQNSSPLPWYIIDGSIMTSFPDSWALGEHFIVLPLNHLDKPFHQVRLGGITCDSDDIYPRRTSQALLYMPVETDELYLGFFAIGAYQEMLGGVGGSKHCVIPEADELLIDQDPDGAYEFVHLAGQDVQRVLRNLGYLRREGSR